MKRYIVGAVALIHIVVMHTMIFGMNSSFIEVEKLSNDTFKILIETSAYNHTVRYDVEMQKPEIGVPLLKYTIKEKPDFILKKDESLSLDDYITVEKKYDEFIKKKMSSLVTLKSFMRKWANDSSAIYEIYKLICTYIPDEKNSNDAKNHTWLDYLLAPLPENEQQKIKEMRQKRPQQGITTTGMQQPKLEEGKQKLHSPMVRIDSVDFIGNEKYKIKLEARIYNLEPVLFFTIYVSADPSMNNFILEYSIGAHKPLITEISEKTSLQNEDYNTIQNAYKIVGGNASYIFTPSDISKHMQTVTSKQEDKWFKQFYAVYKIMCVYIPDKKTIIDSEHTYLDYLLAALPKDEQEKIKVMRQKRFQQKTTEAPSTAQIKDPNIRMLLSLKPGEALIRLKLTGLGTERLPYPSIDILLPPTVHGLVGTIVGCLVSIKEHNELLYTMHKNTYHIDKDTKKWYSSMPAEQKMYYINISVKKDFLDIKAWINAILSNDTLSTALYTNGVIVNKDLFASTDISKGVIIDLYKIICQYAPSESFDNVPIVDTLVEILPAIHRKDIVETRKEERIKRSKLPVQAPNTAMRWMGALQNRWQSLKSWFAGPQKYWKTGVGMAGLAGLGYAAYYAYQKPDVVHAFVHKMLQKAHR